MPSKSTDSPPKRVSFRSKEASSCPVCSNSHNREDLLSGGGRLIAGNLTKELRRLYKPSHKYGLLYPAAYLVQVCPSCLYSSYIKDFKKITEEEKKNLKATQPHRSKIVSTLFGKLDFNNDRNLILGIASYILAIDCYHFRGVNVSPTAKAAISALRVAWLLDDLFKEVNYRPYDKVRDFYYIHASKFYTKTLEYMQNGKESVDAVSYMLGPDTDHNWGYDGVLYLNSYLLFKNRDLTAKNEIDKIKILETAKKYLSKIYGMGKSSKVKPGPIVDMSKDLFDEITAILGKDE